jgi:hypothetical protein
MEEETERLELMRQDDGRVLLMTSNHKPLTKRQAKELARAWNDGCEMVLENKEED